MGRGSRGKGQPRRGARGRRAGAASRPAAPRIDPVAEMVGRLVGRAVYGAGDYREVPDPGDGQPIDVCGGCVVDCCARFTVPLNLVDAWRLRSALRVPWTAFAALELYRPGLPTFPVRLGERSALLALRRRRGACVFRLRLGRQHRCGVHALRPTACRLFPFLPDLDAQRCSPQGMLAQRPPRDCPWRWPATERARAGLEEEIAQGERARALDQEVLRLWHRQHALAHSERNFFHFLQLEMEKRGWGAAAQER